jgi:hypothetical protein
VGGAAAAVAAAVALVWRPWRSSSGNVASSRGRTGPPGPRTGSSPYGPTARWVQAENAKPGTTAWNVSNGGKPGDLEG